MPRDKHFAVVQGRRVKVPHDGDRRIKSREAAAPKEPGRRDGLCITVKIDARRAWRLGRFRHFLRTSFSPQHMSFAGPPSCQPTPATSM